MVFHHLLLLYIRAPTPTILFLIINTTTRVQLLLIMCEDSPVLCFPDRICTVSECAEWCFDFWYHWCCTANLCILLKSFFSDDDDDEYDETKDYFRSDRHHFFEQKRTEEEIMMIIQNSTTNKESIQPAPPPLPQEQMTRA